MTPRTDKIAPFYAEIKFQHEISYFRFMLVCGGITLCVRTQIDGRRPCLAVLNKQTGVEQTSLCPILVTCLWWNPVEWNRAIKLSDKHNHVAYILFRFRVFFFCLHSIYLFSCLASVALSLPLCAYLYLCISLSLPLLACKSLNAFKALEWCKSR